jgi:hypothetical protein
MSATWKMTAVIGAALVIAPIAVALAQPQAAACATINYRGLSEVVPGIFASSDVTIDQRLGFARLHTAAKRRVAETFGATRAAPVIVMGSTAALRRLFPGASPYASTVYIPFRSCVIVGPEGHDIDILAHEGLHAELHYRVGHWYRLTQIPTWFDEGLAMQVDYRERYAWSPQSGAVNSGSVKRWTSRTQFFSGDDATLTRHYAMAKEEVRLWLQKVGHHRLYDFLDRIRLGEEFVEMYEQ